MAKLITFPCPVCGKNLAVSSAEQDTRCVHCGKLLHLNTADGRWEAVNKIDNLEDTQPDPTQPTGTNQPVLRKARHLRLRPDPELKKIPPMLFPPAPTRRVDNKQPIIVFAKMPPTPVVLPGQMMSAVEQIDEILQENIAGMPLEQLGIRLMEDSLNGVMVQAGRQHFQGIDSVTDPAVKDAIKAAIAQWEAEQNQQNEVSSPNLVTQFAEPKIDPTFIRTSDPDVKKFSLIFIAGSVAVILIIIVGLFAMPRFKNMAAPHAITQMENMELAWQRDDIYVDWTNDTDLQAQDNKIFFVGALKPFYPDYGFVLEADSGKVIAKTDQIEGYITGFTADDNAFYIATSGYGLYKYDYQTGQKVWGQDKRFVKPPENMRINHGELLMNIYGEAYSFSTRDGSPIQDSLALQDSFLSIDRGIYTTGDGELIGIKAIDSRAWAAKIRRLAYGTSLLFRDGRVFIQSGYKPHPVDVYNQQTADLLWNGEYTILSNIAVSPRRVYFLTAEGLLGLNVVTGEKEALVLFLPKFLLDQEQYANEMFHVAYDDASGLVLLLLGNSKQLIAFREK